YRRNPLLRALGPALVGAAIVSVHGAGAAMHSYLETAFFNLRSKLEEATVAHAPLDELALPMQDVFVLAALEQTTSWALPYVRHALGRSRPKSVSLLSAEQIRIHELRRIADNALELRILGTPYAASFASSVYRAESLAFTQGQRFHTARFDVEVLAL